MDAGLGAAGLSSSSGTAIDLKSGVVEKRNDVISDVNHRLNYMDQNLRQNIMDLNYSAQVKRSQAKTTKRMGAVGAVLSTASSFYNIGKSQKAEAKVKKDEEKAKKVVKEKENLFGDMNRFYNSNTYNGFQQFWLGKQVGK